MLKIVNLPPSKSEFNRKLILCYLYSHKLPEIENDYPDDIILLHTILSNKESNVFNCHNAGTVVRFLLSSLATEHNLYRFPITITGSDRMNCRPISDIVNALTSLGAIIHYDDRNGFTPVTIEKPINYLSTNTVSFINPISSQFVSSLMMIGPLFNKGLNINYKSIPSFNYVEMTSKMMNRVGLFNEISDNQIIIAPKNNNLQIVDCNVINPESLSIEKDWSSAAFWYPMFLVSNHDNILLKDLHEGSLQGDEFIKDIMRHYGIISKDTPEGMLLSHFNLESTPKPISKQKNTESSTHYISTMESQNQVIEVDLINTPDLFPVVAVTAAISGKTTKITGIDNLKWKESDRLNAIIKNFDAMGIKTDCNSDDYILIASQNDVEKIKSISTPIILQSFDDHRIAMALTPFTIINDNISIDIINCISKSYPQFLNIE